MQASSDRGRWEKVPKILLHEHLDCSVRPRSLLEWWSADDFRLAPADFPPGAVDAWLRGDREQSVALYHRHLMSAASSSLAAYIAAIGDHVLPHMQSRENLTRIMRERMDDARADGIVAIHVRFAPQLHTRAGLSLESVVEAVVEAVTEGNRGAQPAVKLVLCTLRHEDAAMARELTELARQYREHVALVDLAGDEHGRPGVLEWWAAEAVKVREFGGEVTCHLWETEEPGAEDAARLDLYGITRLGHGMRGDLQGQRVLEVCPSSNVVTGQVPSFASHPIDRLLKRGCRVTVNTDGTLFTGSDLTSEYCLLARHFGWDNTQFLAVNKTALEVSRFPESTMKELEALLVQSYRD